MRATGLALIRQKCGLISGSKDRTDENAATGLLVVQVRRLGTVLGKVSEVAPALIHPQRQPDPVRSRDRTGKGVVGKRGTVETH